MISAGYRMGVVIGDIINGKGRKQMKLIRFGKNKNEHPTPGMIDIDDNIRDISALIKDIITLL